MAVPSRVPADQGGQRFANVAVCAIFFKGGGIAAERLLHPRERRRPIRWTESRAESTCRVFSTTRATTKRTFCARAEGDASPTPTRAMNNERHIRVTISRRATATTATTATTALVSFPLRPPFLRRRRKRRRSRLARIRRRRRHRDTRTRLDVARFLASARPAGRGGGGRVGI